MIPSENTENKLCRRTFEKPVDNPKVPPNEMAWYGGKILESIICPFMLQYIFEAMLLRRNTYKRASIAQRNREKSEKRGSLTVIPELKTSGSDSETVALLRTYYCSKSKTRNGPAGHPTAAALFSLSFGCRNP